MDERLHPPIPPQKVDICITKNYIGITLSARAAKIYNALLLNRIRPEIEKILRRNQISAEIDPQPPRS